jgi:hypothetical protein
MTIFLILAPYAAFAALMLVTSAAASLFASAAICLMVMAYDAIRGRSVKMLGAGSVVLFAGVGTYITLVDSSLSSSAVNNAMIIYVPGLPLWSGIAIAFAARNTAVYFTKWYPQYRRAKFAAPAASAGALSGS